MKQSISQRYSVSIDTHEVIDKKVYYCIKLVNFECGTQKITKLRYSEVETIQTKILEWIQLFKMRIHLPPFPKKKLFGITNNSEESILKRRGELQLYFEEVFSYQELHNLGVLEKLLPKTKAHSALKEDHQEEQAVNEIQELKKQYLAKQEMKSSLPKAPPPTTQVYTFHFEEHSLHDDCILYCIQVRDGCCNRTWKFSQRYRDLKEYHRLLRKQNFQVQVPEFPDKQQIKLFDVNDDLKQRKQQLEDYLNKLFSYREIAECEIMTFFIAKSQIEGNEIGCRSKGPSQTTLEVQINQRQNSSLQSEGTRYENNLQDELSKSSRRITC